MHLTVLFCISPGTTEIDPLSSSLMTACILLLLQFSCSNPFSTGGGRVVCLMICSTLLNLNVNSLSLI